MIVTVKIFLLMMRSRVRQRLRMTRKIKWKKEKLRDKRRKKRMSVGCLFWQEIECCGERLDRETII